MKSKGFTLTLLIAFVTAMTVPQAYAQSTGESVLDNPVVIQVNATGTLQATTELNVSFGSGLDFTPDTGEFVSTADQVVTVGFTDNHAGFQSIIVSTNNPVVTDPNGIDVVRSGLITDAEDTASAPLHWVVFDDLADAQAYSFEANVFPDGFIQEGQDVGGKIDNRFNFFVVDRNQTDPAFFSADVLGFASVISGVSATSGSLANAPYDTDPATDDDGDTTTPAQNDGTQRSTADGEVFMKFGADFNGAPAGSYYTNTLTLDMVTI